MVEISQTVHGSGPRVRPAAGEILRSPADDALATPAAQVRLIVWSKDCGYQVEPDPVAVAARYGANTCVLDWHKRLVCSHCGGREVDMVLTGTKRS